MKVWKFRLDESFEYIHPSLKGVEFTHDIAAISDGKITVSKGYAWDGATPKRHIFGLFIIGIPDGALRFGKPWTYHATLVHDVLTQFRHELPLSKSQATHIFNDQLKEAKWPLRKLYVLAVDKLGPQDFGG